VPHAPCATPREVESVMIVVVVVVVVVIIIIDDVDGVM
jgi:hypothetical protein